MGWIELDMWRLLDVAQGHCGISKTRAKENTQGAQVGTRKFSGVCRTTRLDLTDSMAYSSASNTDQLSCQRRCIAT